MTDISKRLVDGDAKRGFALELDMLEPLLSGANNLSLRGEPFFEVQTLKGVVDLLFVRFDARVRAIRRELGLSPVTEIAQVSALLSLTRLGAILGQSTGATTTQLEEHTRISSGHLRSRVLPQLVSAGWVDKVGVKWLVRTPYEAPTFGLSAVELKREDWRGALHQALSHTEFADSSYVALDGARFRNLDRLVPAFEFAGVGLMTLTHGTAPTGGPVVKTTRIIKPSRKRPRGLAHSVVAERVSALKDAGSRAGDVRPVFGRTLTASSGRDPRASLGPVRRLTEVS